MSNDIPLKFCRKCERRLPATTEHFYKHGGHPLGLSSHCKECHKASALNRYHHNPEPKRVSVRQYQARNKALISQRKRERYASNPIPARERVAAWKREHPEALKAQLQKRKAKKRNIGGSYTEQDLCLQLRSQKGLCWWCGEPLDPNDYHVDHRIPLDKGGSNDARNICCTHSKCNLQKNNKMPWEYNGRLL